MKKIAFVSGWYFTHLNKQLDSRQIFMFESLYKTAKKHFLPNQNVNFYFITNSQVQIQGVNNISIECDVAGLQHALLMKILSINYLQEDFDYIFVSDHDQIFVNKVDESIIESDIVILDHFYKPIISDLHKIFSQTVELNFDTKKECWTMGNFFGGKGSTLRDLAQQAEIWHSMYVQDSYDNENHFYSKFPDELFLLKYIFEKNINHKRLTSYLELNNSLDNFFLGDFSNNENVYEKDLNVKLIHDVKKNFDLFSKIINKYT